MYVATSKKPHLIGFYQIVDVMMDMHVNINHVGICSSDAARCLVLPYLCMLPLLQSTATAEVACMPEWEVGFLLRQ